MRVKETYGVYGPESVEEYVERTLNHDRQCHISGELEGLQDALEQTQRALGRICEHLLEKRVILVGDLPSILGSNSDIEEVEDGH